MAILIASTTESQAAIDHAAGDNWDQAFAEPAAADADAENNSGGNADAQAPPEKPDGGKKSRMARLHDRLDEQHQTIESLRSEIAALRGSDPKSQRTAAEGAPTQAGDDVRPQPSDDKYAGDYEKFIEDLADWKYRQNTKADRAKTEGQTQREHAERVMTAYNSQIDAVREAHDDFDDVMAGGDVQIPPALQPAILEAPNGAEIAYHLLKHPEEARKISEMSLAAGAVEIGRLSHMLKPTQQQAAPAKRKPAPLPAPVQPPAAQAATQSKSLDQLPYQEFKRRYNAGER